jgi:hypothetical protein
MNEADALAAGSRADALAALSFDYDQAYQIELTENGDWRGRRLDGLGGWMTGSSPDELGRQLREDYDLKPVPRPDSPCPGLGPRCADVAAQETRAAPDPPS